jgi:5-hydroxyisourate hydrolase-like protein (transthyretin family)
MATVSSHILDSVSGKSAVGIRCQLFQLSGVSERQLVFDVKADDEGRISESVEIEKANRDAKFELVIHNAAYFSMQSIDDDSMVETIVIRFAMTDSHKRYHMPVMLSPHSYSTWWSS